MSSESTGSRCNRATAICSQWSTASSPSLVASKILNSVSCKPYKHFVKNSLLIFTQCLPHHSNPIYWDQTKESFCRSLWSRPTHCQSNSLLFPCSLEQCPTVCPFSHFSWNLQEASQDTSLWLGFPPIDTSAPNGSSMLWNCFIDFAVEYWFGCHTTESGCGRDIGTLENLSDWLIDWYKVLQGAQPTGNPI